MRRKTIDPTLHQKRLQRWMDDLDALIAELKAAELPELDVLAEHCDSIAADLEFQEKVLLGTLPLTERR